MPQVRVIQPISEQAKKLRVAAYARVSSDSADQLNSFATQVAYYTDFIQSKDEWEFAGLYADEGISGIGEGTLEYKEHALLGAIEDLKRVLIGQDPREVERICHELYRDSYWRVGPVLQSAISALNIAMWDIKAKALQVPLYELLGGKVRDSVRMYANVWFAGAKEPDEFAAAAKKAVAMGVTALKWDPFGKAYLYMDNQEFFHAIEIVEAVRAAAHSSTCCCGQQRRSADRGAWPL